MFIGLDLGTSALKGLLTDERQAPLATATATYPTVTAGGVSEQDPGDWIAAAASVLHQLKAAQPEHFAAVRAFGLSGQMHSLVALDAAHRPVRPAMLWNDNRGEAWSAAAMRDRPEIAVITGVRPMPSFTAAKLGWLREHEPLTFDRIAHIVLPKDFLRLWLTGDVATDASDAAGTQMFDQGSRRWSPRMTNLLALDASVLPPVLEGSDIAGRLRPELAAQFGIGQVPVVCGGGDAGTGALGTGCIDAGHSMISMGTGAICLGAQGTYHPLADQSVHNFAHCLPARWYHMAAILNCGSALEWACRLTGGRDLSETMQRIERDYRGVSPALFLPYLDGTRTPHCNSDVQGVFLGLDRAVTGEDLVQAVLEGVTFALADADAALGAADGGNACPMLIGGGARSPFWARLVATVFGRPVARVLDAGTGSALGAVRLAMIGTGVGDIGTVAGTPATEIIEPDRERMAAYRDRLAHFRKMYGAAQSYAAVTKTGSL